MICRAAGRTPAKPSGPSMDLPACRRPGDPAERQATMKTRNEIVKGRLDTNYNNRMAIIHSQAIPADEKAKKQAEFWIQEARRQYNEIWEMIYEDYEEGGVEDTVDHDIEDFEVNTLGTWLDHCSYVAESCRESWIALPKRSGKSRKKDSRAFDGGTIQFTPEYIQGHFSANGTYTRLSGPDKTCFDMLLGCKWIGDIISSACFLTIDPSRLSPVMGELMVLYRLYDDTLDAIKGAYEERGSAVIEINAKGIVDGINGIRFDISELEQYLEVNDEELHIAGGVRAYEIENGLFKRRLFSPQLEKSWAAIVDRDGGPDKLDVSLQPYPSKSLAFGFSGRGDQLYHNSGRVILRPQQITTLRLLLNSPDVYIPNKDLPGNYHDKNDRGSLHVIVSAINKWLDRKRIKVQIISGEKTAFLHTASPESKSA
jgi:hypothetical protein